MPGRNVTRRRGARPLPVNKSSTRGQERVRFGELAPTNEPSKRVLPIRQEPAFGAVTGHSSVFQLG